MEFLNVCIFQRTLHALRDVLRLAGRAGWYGFSSGFVPGNAHDPIDGIHVEYIQSKAD